MHDARQMVPTADSAANITSRDVIGSKTDTHAGSSILSHTHSVDEHVHTPCLTYPTLANGVAVGTAAGGWGLSAAFVEVVPINTITNDFDIHWVCIEALDDNTTYELWLYAVEVFIGRVRIVKNAVQDGTMNIPFQTSIIPANTQIQAKAASQAGTSVVTMSIFYHIYA